MGRLVLYAASDLIWATKIKATADAEGIAARPARNPEMLRARLADSDVAALMIDLDAPDLAWPLLDVLRGPEAGASLRGVRVVCWGPHVEEDLFREARTRGADVVMTRGALHARLGAVLRELAGADSR